MQYLHDLYPKTRTDVISVADGFYEKTGFYNFAKGFRKIYTLGHVEKAPVL
jgi:hypothetical protein